MSGKLISDINHTKTTQLKIAIRISMPGAIKPFIFSYYNFIYFIQQDFYLDL